MMDVTLPKAVPVSNLTGRPANPSVKQPVEAVSRAATGAIDKQSVAPPKPGQPVTITQHSIAEADKINDLPDYLKAVEKTLKPYDMPMLPADPNAKPS
ncbi:hypothetical protein AADZ90_017770 [Aestuariibius sp. 2305UL40-4]|uniref:hypothetical protein n=1 Tax=Aestuariibius violaceus TaxID=3234132 RepID=UPI00345E9EE5